MRAIVKWPGGKERELNTIRKFMPDFKGKFIDPFVGGGAVYFDMIDKQCVINDSSKELINLYKCIKYKDIDFKTELYKMCDEFEDITKYVFNNKNILLSLYNDNTVNLNLNLKGVQGAITRKTKRVAKIEEENHIILSEQERLNNIETVLKSCYYNQIRDRYNSTGLTIGEQTATFYFIREFCYSSTFRYNSKGKFNVPYGGMSYNNKNFRKKVDYLFSNQVYEKLNLTTLISNEDFETFLNSLKITEDDFMFLDPPYDSDFSTYCQNEFTREDHERLCEYLKTTKAKIMMIIKNTDFIYNLYKNDFIMNFFDKRYLVNYMNRNDKMAQHLIITNYR